MTMTAKNALRSSVNHLAKNTDPDEFALIVADVLFSRGVTQLEFSAEVRMVEQSQAAEREAMAEAAAATDEG